MGKLVFNPFTSKLDYTSPDGYGATLPSNGTNGDVFFNTSDSTLYVWSAGSWLSVGSGTPVSHTGELIGTGAVWGITYSS